MPNLVTKGLREPQRGKGSMLGGYLPPNAKRRFVGYALAHGLNVSQALRKIASHPELDELLQSADESTEKAA